MMSRKLFTIVLIAISGLLSCQKNPLPEIQSEEGTITLSSEAGSRTIKIEATGYWTATVKGAVENWAAIDRNEGNGDADLILKYKANDKYSRMCRIVIEQESSAKTDTIFVKQYGKAEIISLGRESISFPVVDDERNIAINGNFSNAQLSKIKIDVKYEGSSTDWINAGIDIPTASLKVTNTTNDQVGERKAEVILTYKDGWETEHSLSLPVTQMGNRAANATQVTFAELKSRIAEAAGTLTIADDITIEGVVINDNDNPNSAMNPNLSQTTIDYSVNYRTSYLQTEDASEGVSIVFNTTEDNVLKSLMKARISLKDAVLEKLDNPERYVIREIPSTYVVAIDKESITALPEKVRSMGELTDKDVFTFVTLKNCEFPVKDGSYTAVNEGYCSSYNAARFDTWPMLVRDIEGNDMYLMTNIDCSYRRDGSGLPLGSGRISGVIVHDTYTRFEQDGNIGRYQMRALSEEDIRLAEDQDAGFSTILAEWAVKQDEKVDNHWTLKASAGKGIFKHSSGAWMSADHNYLHPGPVDGTENKGQINNKAWASNNWIDGDSFRYWLMDFSTEGINSNVISVQFNTLAKTGGPRYWAVEVSVDNGTTWTRCLEYTVPDIVNWSNTLYTQTPGGKSVTANLPAEACNRERVLVRLIPTANSAGTSGAYDGASISHRNVITYAAIRYNK